jgi:hypothetical protein
MHDASYGVCIAAQRYCNALIRGDGAHIHDDLASRCFVKSVGPQSCLQPQLCCAACRVTDITH